MGDCIHQRAVLRQLMATYTVSLETSWASMYHDLIAEGLIVMRRSVSLRTQNKNQQREAALFSSRRPVGNTVRIRYGGGEVMQTESKTVLEAMCRSAGVSFADADYTLPVPDPWFQELFKTLGPITTNTLTARTKPWLVYRPLVARPEWRGSMVRNANPQHYAELFQLIRDTFFVVSVADLEPGREWIVGPELKADLTLHRGELTFETMAALFKAADLVYTSSGFAAILAPAVKTPVVSIVGGYEALSAHASGAKFVPYLGIGPRVECACWTSQCRQTCDKAIDMDMAADQLRAFVSQIGIQIADNVTPLNEMFFPTTSPTIMGGQHDRLLQQMRGLRA